MTGRATPWWHRPRARAVYERGWAVLTGAVLAAGGFVAVRELGWAAVVMGLAFGIISIGACIVTFAGPERPASYLLALRVGAFVPAVVIAGAALVGVAGPVGLLPTTLVCLLWPGWPALLARGRAALDEVGGRDKAGSPDSSGTAGAAHARVPGTADMSDFEAMLVDTGPGTADPADSADPSGTDHASSPLRDLPTDEVCRLWRRTFVLLAQELPPRSVLELLAVRDQCLQELEVREPRAYRQLIESGATPASDLKDFFHGDAGGALA
jgi:hypothetical protein